MPKFWSDPANDGLPTVPSYRPTREQVRRWREARRRRGVVGDGVQFRLGYFDAETAATFLERLNQPRPAGPERVVVMSANDDRSMAEANLVPPSP